MKWISPKTITGPPAEGKVYLRREYINDEFWKRINNGEHIIFAAPRRVGKSSVMKDLENNFPDDYITIYNNIESDNTQHDFFKRLFILLLEKLKTYRKVGKNISTWLKTIGIEEFSIKEINIKFKNKELDFKEELLNLIKLLGKETIHIVMLLDEFPEVIENIRKKEGAIAAIDTLHTLRSIRHDKNFRNFSFAFAGSIGLSHIVASLDRTKLINDLVPINVESLSLEEADELINQLIEGATMIINKNVKEYLFKKISYLLPYYIQLMIEKCDFILCKEIRPELTNKDIDSAFEMVVKEGRNFDDWESRLKRYFGNPDANYCIAILTCCAHSEMYTIQQAYNLSKKKIPETGYKELLDNVLLKDGYLAENKGSYTFLSPIFREWWKKRHPIFEIEELL